MRFLPIITLVLALVAWLMKWIIRNAEQVVLAAAADSRSLEEKLAMLSDCGLKLAEPFTVEDLLESFERERYEKPGWETVLVGLGIEDETRGGYHSANLWSFDSECIEDHGDYAAIIKRIANITQGSLPLENITDYVDIDNAKAWVSFTLNGQAIRWDLAVDDDWADLGIFDKLVHLLEEADPSKLLIWGYWDGQGCLIGCVTETELAGLKAIGIPFDPLHFGE